MNPITTFKENTIDFVSGRLYGVKVTMNDTSIRVAYAVIGEPKMKYITLASELEIAKFYLKNHIIGMYKVEDDEVKMYGHPTMNIYGDWRSPSFDWRSFEITETIATRWCALEEIKLTDYIMGTHFNQILAAC